MAKRHDAVFNDVLSGLEGEEATTMPAQARYPAGGSRFLKRSTAIAERLNGEVVEQTLRWIDPTRCKMWPRHNRRYDLLTEQRCADLIEGFRAQGQQKFPAIVRSIVGDANYDYEVFCSARRHWTVNWLRAHTYTQFKFSTEVRELTDEEAFCIADVENREREDIFDDERACDYADALKRYYNGQQQDMAARFEISESWLSRYLQMSKLPTFIVEACGNPNQIKERHTRELRSLIALKAGEHFIKEVAVTLMEAQQRLLRAGETILDGATVFARMKAAVKKRAVRKTAASTFTEKDASGRLAAKATVNPRGALTLTFSDEIDCDTARQAAESAISIHWQDVTVAHG